MSLVGYDASSSDDEQTDTKPDAQSKATMESKGRLTNKQTLNKLTPYRIAKTGIQISAPKLHLSDSDDSDSDSGPLKKAKFNHGTQARSGLFAKLPAPINAPPSGRKSKSETPMYKFRKENTQAKKTDCTKAPEAMNSTAAAAKNVSTSSIAEIRKRSAEAAAKLLSNNAAKETSLKNDSEDEDGDTGFFSYVDKVVDKEIPDKEIAESEPIMEPVGSLDLAPHVDYTSPHEQTYPSLSWPESIPYETSKSIPQQEWNTGIPANSQEMIRLQGKRNRNEELNFIDFHEDDALRGGKEMLLKTISEEKGMDRTRVEVPGGMMKKKHQLPYLIQQAKAREVELKNTWAQNRQTKQQTQSKYGW